MILSQLLVPLVTQLFKVDKDVISICAKESKDLIWLFLHSFN